jgi:hypothetical protein
MNKLTLGFSALTAALWAAGPAHAQQYPTKALRLMVWTAVARW